MMYTLHKHKCDPQSGFCHRPNKTTPVWNGIDCNDLACYRFDEENKTKPL